MRAGHDAVDRRRAMIGLFLVALVIGGAFTFVPGRIMHAVAFGNSWPPFTVTKYRPCWGEGLC